MTICVTILWDENGLHATTELAKKHVQNMLAQGYSPSQIDLGIPFYARPTTGEAYWYGYNGCYEGIDENGWYHCDDINKDFWFNTPEVIESKTQYAIDNGFGGVMIWHYNCDLPSSHEDSLLRAIGTAVNDNY